MLVSFPASADLAFTLEALGAFLSVIAQEFGRSHQGVRWLPADQWVGVGKRQKVLGDGESGVTPPTCSAWGCGLRAHATFGARPRLSNYAFYVLQLASNWSFQT